MQQHSGSQLQLNQPLAAPAPLPGAVNSRRSQFRIMDQLTFSHAFAAYSSFPANDVSSSEVDDAGFGSPKFASQGRRYRAESASPLAVNAQLRATASDLSIDAKPSPAASAAANATLALLAAVRSPDEYERPWQRPKSSSQNAQHSAPVTDRKHRRAQSSLPPAFWRKSRQPSPKRSRDDFEGLYQVPKPPIDRL